MRLSEEDYFWITQQLVKIANLTANGRIVSVLEGGYKVQGRVVSPFARSVAAHVRALSSGCSVKWDTKREREALLREMTWEAERERERLEKARAEKELTERDANGGGIIGGSGGSLVSSSLGISSKVGNVTMSSTTPQASDGGLLSSTSNREASEVNGEAKAVSSASAAASASSDRRAGKRRRDGPPIDYAALDAKLQKEEEEARLKKGAGDEKK
jgi:hypothetical protein